MVARAASASATSSGERPAARGVQFGELLVGPREHGDVGGATASGERAHQFGDAGGLGGSGGERSHSDVGPVGPGAAGVVGLARRGERGGAGAHHLRRAAVVGGEPHDGDAGVAHLHLREGRVVGAVPAVDRLAGVADEAQIGSPAADRLEHGVLQRVEVLRLVDEQVAEPPTDEVGEGGVAMCRVEDPGQQVVEVEDAAPALQPFVRGDEVGVAGRRHGAAPAGGAHRGLVPAGFDEASTGPVDIGRGEGRLDRQAQLGEAFAQQSNSIGDHLRGGLVSSERPIAQQPEGDAVERARLDAFADLEPAQASLQLRGRLAREREREHVRRVGGAGRHPVGDPPREHRRLARPGRGDDRER